MVHALAWQTRREGRLHLLPFPSPQNHHSWLDGQNSSWACLSSASLYLWYFINIFIQRAILLKMLDKKLLLLCNKLPVAIDVAPQMSCFTRNTVEMLWEFSFFEHASPCTLSSILSLSARGVCSPGRHVGASWARCCHSHPHICMNHMWALSVHNWDNRKMPINTRICVEAIEFPSAGQPFLSGTAQCCERTFWLSPDFVFFLCVYISY